MFGCPASGAMQGTMPEMLQVPVMLHNPGPFGLLGWDVTASLEEGGERSCPTYFCHEHHPLQHGLQDGLEARSQTAQ